MVREETPSRWLSVEEAAAYTGQSRSKLNKLRVTGGGALFSKVGGRVVYHPRNLDAWLDEHARKSTSQHEARSQ